MRSRSRPRPGRCGRGWPRWAGAGPAGTPTAGSTGCCFRPTAPSANQLLPEHQQLAVGDRVPDGPPEADCLFTVERLEPERLLVLRSTRHLPASWRQRGLAMDWIRIGMPHDLLSRCYSGHQRSARRRDVVLERTYAWRLSGMG